MHMEKSCELQTRFHSKHWRISGADGQRAIGFAGRRYVRFRYNQKFTDCYGFGFVVREDGEWTLQEAKLIEVPINQLKVIEAWNSMTRTTKTLVPIWGPNYFMNNIVKLDE